MNRLLFDIYVPAAQKSYDVAVPADMALGQITALISEAISQLSGSLYLSDSSSILCDRESGAILNINMSAWKLGLRNGSRLTVLPTDTSLLQIEDGKDLVTLVTCTPFGVNTHRLLVRSHQVPYVPEQKATAAAEKSAASSWTRHYLTGLTIGFGVVAVAGGGYFLMRRKRHA